MERVRKDWVTTVARGSIRNAVKEIEQRKSALGENGEFHKKLFFKLADGEQTVVRFLEEGDNIAWAWVHSVEFPNTTYPSKVVCIDQDEEGRPTGERCPGCESGLKRSFQGAINLIWRDAPVFQRDSDNRLIKDGKNKPVVSHTEDQTAVWASGITVFEEIESLDLEYGLMSRDFKVTRRGERLATKYSILPLDKEDLSPSDIELAAAKLELQEYVVAPPFDSWGKVKYSANENSEPVETIPDTSPFNKKRKNG